MVESNKFLFLAYGFLWLLFILYAWNLSRRQARLKKELDELQAKMPGPPRSSSLSS
jgi:CcmD family protein